MFGSTVLEIGFGLALIYLLLSLVCSQINEFIATIFASRAKTLRKGIENLLRDIPLPDSRSSSNVTQSRFVDKFFDHPLIQSLTDPGKNKISYIPSRIFSLVLLDLLMPQLDHNADGRIDIQKTINTLPEGELKKTLAALVMQSGITIKTFHNHVERWFDDTMDRVSGWYKRTTQIWIFWIALCLSLLVNADTITIIRSISQDEILRKALVNQASAFSAQQPDSLSLATLRTEAERLPIAIGWSTQSNDPRRFPWIASNWQEGVINSFMKFIGLVITILAISLGAPFWFDVLSKFVNLRTTGKRPGDAPQWPEIEPTRAAKPEEAGDKSGS